PNHRLFPSRLAWIIARIPALMAGGRYGHASKRVTRSQSIAMWGKCGERPGGDWHKFFPFLSLAEPCCGLKILRGGTPVRVRIPPPAVRPSRRCLSTGSPWRRPVGATAWGTSRTTWAARSAGGAASAGPHEAVRAVAAHARARELGVRRQG